MSTKFKLDKQDLINISRQIVIIYSPVILLFLDQIQEWKFDYKIVVALIISTSIDILRRYLKDYTK